MFKRVLSLCVALVFVAGASGDLFAQGVRRIFGSKSSRAEFWHVIKIRGCD